MNRRGKGRKNELEYKKKLEGEGYKVYLVPKSNKYGSQDVFEAWDIISLKDNRLTFIQVKTNRAENKAFYVEQAKSLPFDAGAWLVVAYDKNKQLRFKRWRKIDLKKY